MTFIKNAIAAAAQSATTAAETDSKADNVKFNGNAGDDYLFVQGNNNTLIGCVGDDIVWSEGNCNKVYGDDTCFFMTDGCNRLESTTPFTTQGGTDQVYSFGNDNLISGGYGEDLLYSEGDNNWIQDIEGDTTVRNFGEGCRMDLSYGTHDVAIIGSDTDLRLGNGEHSIMIAGKRNKVTTGNDAFKLIFMGDLDLNGGDVIEDDEETVEMRRLVEDFLTLANKVEVDCQCTSIEYEMYSRYAQFADLIGEYTPPEAQENCECKWKKFIPADLFETEKECDCQA